MPADARDTNTFGGGEQGGSELMTIAIYGAAAALGVVCILLFVLAVRRLLARQEEMIATMLQRYDNRLAEFAQTLNDALSAPLPARILAAIAEPEGPIPQASLEHGEVMRLLEVARASTSSDAAVAVVAEPNREPMLATVGLSQDEAVQVSRLGVPDYRGARAIQVSFNGEATSPSGGPPLRTGLAVPLLDPPHEPGMLAVLTRSPDRRFSDPDIASLEDAVHGTRPALESSFALREPDPVPELDPLTELYDRRAFQALLEREIGRARLGSHELGGNKLALLVLDVDRLTTLNARIGHLAADSVLADVSARLREVAGRDAIPCRVGGGRFAVLVPGGDGPDAEHLYERLRHVLHARTIPDIGVVTVSGGAAELLSGDDAPALIGRADAALGLAKGSGRDRLVTAGRTIARDAHRG
jgi:diguanylate cyclase (GGDEF)-like protein